MSPRKSTSRREFLKHSAAASAGLALPWIIVPRARARQNGGTTAASDRLGVAIVGTGGMGTSHLGALLDRSDVQLRAICDVDSSHLEKAAAAIKEKYGDDSCQRFADFRELLAAPGIDAVWVTTPDHWHALVAIAALEAGKDVYCEKPLTNSVGEGRAVCDAVAKHGRVLQCGSHERSNPDARFGCELVRNGRLGKIHTVRISLPCDEWQHEEARSRQIKLKPLDPPSELQYDFWLGHTPKIPYAEHRCHFWWRFNTQFGGGELTDRGAHVIDLAQLGLGTDDTGPVEFRAKGTRLGGELYDACLDFEFENLYANGVRMIGVSSGTRGVKFEGTKGSLFIHVHGGKLEAEPASLLQETIGDGEIHLGRTPDHRSNFIEAVRKRDPKHCFATAEIGHRTASICHLNNLAVKLGRTLKWDPVKEIVIGDDEAQALITPKMRAPWHLPS